MVQAFTCEEISVFHLTENLPVKEGGDAVLSCDFGKFKLLSKGTSTFSVGVAVDRCLWRKNGRIVNLYSEKYEIIGKKSQGDCSVR